MAYSPPEAPPRRGDPTIPYRILAPLLLLALLLGGAAGAQSPFDPRALFGSGAAAEEEPQQSRPAQSTPRPAFDPASVPPPEAYGALTGQGAPLDRAQRAVDRFRERAVAILEEAPRAFDELGVTLAAASKTGDPAYFLGVGVFALLLLAVGRAVAQLFAVFLARPWFVGLQRAAPRGYAEKLPVLASRVGLTVVGTALSLATASAVGLVFHDGHKATLDTVLIIFGAYGAIMVIDTVWRMVTCPYLPGYRIPAIGSSEARRLYRWLVYVSAVGVISIGFCYWVHALGLPHTVHLLFTIGLTALTVLALLAMMRANRRTIDRIVLDGQRRDEASWVTRLALGLWAPLGVVYLLGTLGKLTSDMVMTGLSEPLGLIVPYLVLLGGLAVYAVATWAIERVFARDRAMAEINAPAAAPEPRAAPAPPNAAHEKGHDGDTDRGLDVGADSDMEGGGPVEVPEPARVRELRPGPGMKSFEDLARRVASLVAIGAAAYGLLYYWGGAALFDESMAFGIAEDVIDLAFVGYVAFHATRIWIDRRIAEEGGDEQPLEPGEGEGGGAGASRLATLLPLLRSFVLGTIVIAIGLAVAAEIGLNVAPLFAGAGIVGIAIGFGSQTLIRDILSGAFFLLDDAFRRGEYIDVGEVKGTVEKISLRSFQLRHHLGMLHTIPFGEIKHLTNFSRDWVMMKLPLRLTYDTDVEKVRKLVKKLGQELLEDPQIGDKFLQPLKSQGVVEMQDSAMIVRVKFMTKPGEQWVIRKRVFQEIRDLFEREGVKFAHREVTVRIPDLPKDRELSETESRAVGSAARNAIDLVEEHEPPLAAAGGRGGDDR
jgi:small-conductance mechanosensitive channel